MARTRVFISSTFYDLKHVRNELEGFLKSLGYDPIMNDRGNIPYAADQSLESNCLQEISSCDILIGIVGGNYGSSSRIHDEHSISMSEIQTAITLNKQLFICIDKQVYSENKLYLKNKDNKDIKYVAVSDIRIHKFIEELQALPQNNAIIEFESTNDIISFIKEQFSGLFQRLLQDKANMSQQSVAYDLSLSITSLNSAISELKSNEAEFANKFSGTIYANNFIITSILMQLKISGFIAIILDQSALFEFFGCLGFEMDMPDAGYDYAFVRTKDGLRQSFHIVKEIFDEDNKIKEYRRRSQFEDLIKYAEEPVSDDIHLPFDI